MSNEIFYLESCLAIEKSIEDVRESVRYIDDDFMFESPKDVFETIKRKILELIRKVKEIFNSVAMRKKNAETVKKAKKVKNGKIKIRNHKKLFELYDNCMKAVKSGKDPKKVKDKWKKGLIILGFTAIFPLFMASAAMAGIASSLTPTSLKLAGIPRMSFKFRISSASIKDSNSSAPSGSCAI